MKECNKYI